MAFDHHNMQTGPLQLRGESSKLVTSEDMAGRIINMELTESGTLRSVVGPMEYHPTDWNDNGGTVPASTNYQGPRRGIFHCLLEGGKRDVLLAHFNEGIYIHDGFTPRWRILIGDLATAEYQTALPENDDRPGFLTQFVATPNGVVIIPQGGRAYFYDGTTAAPLGFARAPGPPGAKGPALKEADNGENYTPAGVVDNLFADIFIGKYYHSGRTQDAQMGTNRLGSVRNDTIDVATGKKANPLGGTLEPGEWRTALQFVDHWGNLSPLSGRSAPVQIGKEDNLVKTRKGDEPESSERLKIQAVWTDLNTGPPHTVGRNIYRTRDVRNAGTDKLYWLPPNATANAGTFATMADNTTLLYPDNIPDTWLLKEAQEIDPVPIFRLACLAFGRLWIANVAGNPGLMRPSEPGFWGTFPANQEIYPDATGAEITGLVATQRGLLAFTATSTFLITQDISSNRAQQFNAVTVNSQVGCVAPGSIQTLPNGLTVWLGREGFYAFKDGQVINISGDIQDRHVRVINRTWQAQATSAVDPRMGEYRVWLPTSGSKLNNLGLVFDGVRWRERTDVVPEAVCTTKDSRSYMLALGTATVFQLGKDTPVPSVWLLDHTGLSTAPPVARTATLETTWLRNTRSVRKGSPFRLFVWMRETDIGNLTVEVFRDWREHPKVPNDENGPSIYAEDDPPTFWGNANWSEEYENQLTGDSIPRHFVRRRPHWGKVDVMVPSCEVFKVRLTFEGDFEFIGISYEDKDRHAGGAKIAGRQP